MLRLLINLRLFKVRIEGVITVSLSCSVIFNTDFDHICLFRELMMVAIDTLLSILLGLLSVSPATFSFATFLLLQLNAK